jgi:glycosyltransferase involved in cell wall biosynthesis
MKAMNVAFCSWIAGIRNAEVWIMFHEVAVPWAPWWRWKQNVVAATTRLMARLLLSRVDRTLISIPSWEAMLHGMAPRWKGATWLPIPSNIPTTVAPEAIARVRQSLPLRDGGRTIGHFGTYGPLIVPVLMRTLRELLRSDTGRIAVLVGRGSESVAKALQQDPIINGRVVASGTVSATEVAAHLIACDLLVQPYPDGMSTRRTSAMAGLALGVPTVTNQGHATESLWRETQAVELATSEDDLVATAERVLRDSAHAAALGHRARALYDRQFSIEHTVHSLRETGHGGAV